MHGRILLGPFQKLDNQSHTHELTILDLTEISGTRVVIHLLQDLIHTRERMEHDHRILRKRHLGLVQDEAVLHPLELRLIQETLLLNAGHIEHIQLAHNGLHIINFLIINAIPVADLILHIGRQLKFLRSDENDLHILVAGKSLDQRVDGTSELEVAAETDGEIVQTAELTLDGQQVGQGLGRMSVGTVTGIDNRDGRDAGSIERSALDWVPHSNYIRKTADYPRGILDSLALGNGSVAGIRKADHVAAQFHHRRSEAETGPGRWLIEESSELLALAGT